MNAVVLIAGLVWVSSDVSAGDNAGLNANIDAETRIAQRFDDYRIARDSVLRAIADIKDESRKKTVTLIFERNERAWDQLIESETLLQQGAKSADSSVDIRYRRIADAKRARQRIEHYNEFVILIQTQK